MMRFSLSLFLTLALSYTLSANAFWESGDRYSMEIRGYSAEITDYTLDQIDKQEGRYIRKPISTRRQSFYNLLNNKWIWPKERFGNDHIEHPPFYQFDDDFNE